MPLKNSSTIIQCQSCEYTGKVLIAHHGYKWWMVPAAIAIFCTGIGCIPMAVILIYLGNKTFNVCPQCGSRDVVPCTGLPLSPDYREIWTVAKDADEKAFKQNKLILLAVTATMFAAAFAFMLYMMRKD